MCPVLVTTQAQAGLTEAHGVSNFIWHSRAQEANEKVAVWWVGCGSVFNHFYVSGRFSSRPHLSRFADLFKVPAGGLELQYQVRQCGSECCAGDVRFRLDLVCSRGNQALLGFHSRMAYSPTGNKPASTFHLPQGLNRRTGRHRPLLPQWQGAKVLSPAGHTSFT